MTGAGAVPFRLLLNAPLYVPPRSQIVSPGFTTKFLFVETVLSFNAVAKSHGLLMLPSPVGEPVGETYQLFAADIKSINKNKNIPKKNTASNPLFFMNL